MIIHVTNDTTPCSTNSLQTYLQA